MNYAGKTGETPVISVSAQEGQLIRTILRRHVLDYRRLSPEFRQVVDAGYTLFPL
jgi:hypothetical protein